jgi:replicative superfamily II helicase
MIIDKVANDIHESDEFQNLYKNLLTKELHNILHLEPSIIGTLSEDDLDTLLECAIIYATVDDDSADAAKYHDIAYRIAILLSHYYGEYTASNEAELYLVFSRLGRYPIAAQYFNARDTAIHDSLPIFLFGPAEFSRKLNTIKIGEQQYILTNFQKKFWNRIHNSKQLAICAPTSAGKSFILTQYLVSEYFAHESNFIAVYVVPTNALINEVSDNILECSKRNFRERPALYTTGVDTSEVANRKAVYVLTQEKLSSLIAKMRDREEPQDFNVDLLIVDEAQIIADGERGGITKNVIEDLLSNNENTHIVLGSPPVQNLEGYAKFFELKELTTYPETINPVAKNLIRIHKKKGSTTKFDVTVSFGSTFLSRNSLEINGITLGSVYKCLAGFAMKYGHKDPSLIYASVPSDCIKIAGVIAESDTQAPIANANIEEFSQFITDYIHPEFKLAEYIKKGVGFHFGALPLVVTKQLEEKFRNRDFPYLASTSTLLHGVNLPAKNLFLCRPKKGKSEPLDNIEFWNLIGRAGRLGKDFQGNVFVIENENETEDSPLWSTEYIASEGTQTIESALDKCLKLNPETQKSDLGLYLDEVIRSDKIPEARRGVENVFSQLLYYQRKGRLKQSLERSTLLLDEHEIGSIMASIQSISNGLTVDSDLLDGHRDISPLRIQRLYDRLSELAANNEIAGTNRIPKHPTDNKNSQAYKSLETIFFSLFKYFGVGGNNARQSTFATIAFKWMEGENYNVLAREYVENSDFGSEDTTTKIHNFFSVLQREISYEYAKYMRCYISVLELVNYEAETPFLHENAHIAPLHSYLEDGTYITSQLSLIKNGLSRMSAIEVYRILQNQLGTNAELAETKATVRSKAAVLKRERPLS